ncbi:FAS1-like dehydratase domain-containing protein [Polymorphum gilvum]|uniref:Hypothetical cytosolic protein n=1 Tax=Polymorphum gilvum (strain LMG 25793 / CGMCC 1.9160 / SL003B-26A1) TaxID=991905 RepID=F2J3Y2_POLGS|nr:MaoC family dehydratase N-terminal domain-containing protein [Polymorphum gilvum]ADZ68964.1 Hypothetical cytosolic protein [Polymorphum gilvum SL003B-26A1]
MNAYADWIGRSEQAEEVLGEGLVERFRAMLAGTLWEAGEGAPLGIHWCLAPPAVAPELLARDGHPRRDSGPGSFLPPIPLPARMWAGGEIRFLAPVPIGARIVRRSRIAGISSKEGRTGPLVFVAVDHVFDAGGEALISERQDIVYKAAPAPGNTPAYAPDAQMPRDGIRLGPVTLFRYSALTFNGHRIHYDADYCRKEEAYPACVVHGPLQATLLMNRAAQILGRSPVVFSYRGLAPCFVDEPLRIADGPEDGTVLIEAPDGRITMTAEFR